jgi:hypothetical protein
MNDRGISQVAATLTGAEWIVPPYLQFGRLKALAARIAKDPVQAAAILDDELPVLYNEDFLAAMLLERYRQTPYVRGFVNQIAEAIQATQLGLFRVAVPALLTVVEGVIRQNADARGASVGNGTAKLVDELENLVQNERASSNSFSERIVMLEIFRDFVRDFLLIKTANYSGGDDFNRHGVLHGIFRDYGASRNVYKLLSMVDLLCFTIAIETGCISALAPDSTADSAALADHYRWLRTHRGAVAAHTGY